MTYAEEQKLTESVEMTGFQAVPGNGLSGWCDGERLWGGNLSFIRKTCAVSEDMQAKAKGLADQGKTPLFFAKEDQLLGIIAVADVIKKDSPKAVQELQNMGIRVVMLTGDNEQTARAIGEQAGVDEVIAGAGRKRRSDPQTEESGKSSHGRRRYQ